MADVLAYKCPNCGAPINFDSTSQMMKCGSCGTQMETSAWQAYDAALKQEEIQTVPDWKDEYVTLWHDDALTSSVCKSCGGELVMEKTTVATECPYCGNAAVVSNQVSDMLRPDFIIPFKLDKNAARNILRKFYRGKPLLPKLFKADERIDKITGVYVPFWLYDCDTANNAVYNATKTSSWTVGKTQYTKTDYYIVKRSGTMRFDKIPADGLEKMDDAVMDALEPFDYKGLTNFSMAYLSGFLADKYDVTAEANQPRVDKRVRKSVEMAMRSSVRGYSSVTTKVLNVRIHNGQIHYALFPVWMLNTRWGDKIYSFSINGQTGKLVGDLPIDWKKAAGMGGIILIVAAIALSIIGLVGALSEGVTQAIAIIAAIAALVVALTFMPIFSKRKSSKNKKERDSK
jgi:DNA-directed RNA polymerase subunit RPC12/RpoP